MSGSPGRVPGGERIARAGGRYDAATPATTSLLANRSGDREKGAVGMPLATESVIPASALAQPDKG
ncbi:hypothetical protein [Pseudomonas sp. ANT_H12B]|uniref:hypothetical protein n=1 Tax=Pseudomonas sp. ANT_H12B TaxID=2597348 RepID=UPI0011ECC996|nr:hypothetical protein [Pseudomonas sp. ANT_H12B]KAA0980026.1 hypothetical protein FQ185_00030 [Pseudomonas sp. ANT_H12B]